MTYSTTITQKGQMTLSVEVRKKLGLKTGERVKVSLRGTKVIVEKDNYWQELDKLQAANKTYLRSQGFSDSQLMQMAKDYKCGDGFAAHLKDKYGMH